MRSELQIKVGDTVYLYNVLAVYGRSHLIAERKEGYSKNSGTNRFLVPTKALIESEDEDVFIIADWFKKVADHKQKRFLHLLTNID